MSVLYTYRAIDENGRSVRGQFNAANETDLYHQLRVMGLELVRAAPVAPRRALPFLSKPIKIRDLIQACVHLQQLEAAGVPLITALEDLRDATDHRRLRDILADVYNSVSEGRALSEAFAEHPRVFGHVFSSLVAAGEESGRLGDSFDQLIKHLRWVEEVTTRVKKAARYPLFMLVVMVGLFFFMMAFVVPQVVGFLLSMGQELPIQTQLLVATSDFVIAWWWALLGLPAVAAGLVVAARKASADVARIIDGWMLRLPLVGQLIRKISLSRFAHFFAVMFQSGVPILASLETAQKVVHNRALAAGLAQVRQSVQEGNSLSDGLRMSGEFPSLVVRMVQIGEESGNLGGTLENVTTFYDRDVADTVDALVAAIEPALTVMAGFLMLWIVAAVMGPIYDSLEMIGV